MDWTRAIDAYCERTDASYWSEPVNALTNLAFLLAALVMWRRSGTEVSAKVLCAILFAIGVGSWLFHTHATAWAAVLDVIPILVFSLAYIFFANRDFWGFPVWLSAVGALAFIPYSVALGSIIAALPFLEISAVYWPLPLLIAAYSVALRVRAPETSRNLLVGAGILCVSLVFRSLDAPLCGAVSVGTHFLWHILNALMLGWMIETWLRHRVNSGA